MLDFLFREKLDLETLKNLVRALGENPKFLEEQPERDWSCEYSGIAKVKPVEQGFKVDLDIYSQLFHKGPLWTTKQKLKRIGSYRGIVLYPFQE